MKVRQNRGFGRIAVIVAGCVGLVLALAGALAIRALAMPATPLIVLNGAAQSDEKPYVALPSFAAARADTGVAIHNISDTRLLDAVRDVGFSFVRTDLFWEDVQAADGWHFGGFDALVSNLAQRKLGALFILGYKHYLFSPDQPPTTTPQLAAFYTYVYQSVHRYSGADVRFEVWNEENDDMYWLRKASPSQYRNLLATAVKAARVANPHVIIASGGVQEMDLAFIRSVGDISSATQRGPDAISVHAYRQEYPESVLADYRVLREDLSGYRNVPEIWTTEWSYPSYGYKYVSTIQNGHSPKALATSRPNTRYGGSWSTGYRELDSRPITTCATTVAIRRIGNTTSVCWMRTITSCQPITHRSTCFRLRQMQPVRSTTSTRTRNMSSSS